MKVKEGILSLITIAVIFILPHTGGIPFFGYSIVILLLLSFVLKYSRETFSSIGFSRKRFKPRSILIGSLVAIATVAFMQLLFFPALEYIVTLEDTEVGLYDGIRANLWQFYFFVIMGWLVGGFYEEIVFHGFIFTRLEKIIPGKYATPVSFAITAVIFGAYHFQLGVSGSINALIVGAVYLALFLFFKRNLWYSIFCHGVYNTLVMTLIYYNYL